ncbi:MAG: glutaredoxin family protein [Candidatus Dormibacterales bacterium]
MDVVLYAKGNCADSATAGRCLDALGVEFRLKRVDGDERARREWEDLDGQVTPIVVIDQRQIVRGLDQARLEQLIGWIGC